MTGGAADGRLGDGQIDRPAGALSEIGGEHASAEDRTADALGKMTAGPPASWTSRSVPAVSGIALSATSATGTGQLRSRALIGPPAPR